MESSSNSSSSNSRYAVFTLWCFVDQRI